jgi:hypothetical protein
MEISDEEFEQILNRAREAILLGILAPEQR